MSHVRISAFFSTLLAVVLAVLLVLPTSLALAQEYPPGVDPNAEETPVDLENPGEIIVDIDDSNVITPETSPAQEDTEQVEAEIDFPALLETLKQFPDAPAFLDRLETEADLETLTAEEQEQLSALMQLAFGGPSLETGPDLGELPNTLSCFDHYTFGSVQTNVYHPSGVTTLPAGTTTTFTLLVENENPYPVIDGAVYGKLYRTDLPMDQMHGYPLTAEGFLAEDINLAGESEYITPITYTIPEYLPAGTYELVTYFSTHHRYNLLGLPFTDDVWGNPATFTIENDTPLNDGVIFDKDAVTLNDTPYAFAAFTPKVSPEEPVTITATLENTTDTTVTVPITTTLYGWDQQDGKNHLSTEEDTITITPGERTIITRTVTETAPNYAVYLLSLSATHEDAQSIVNLRFTREDTDAVRINFPTLLSFPLIAGEENALFSCLHGAGTKHVIENTELTLTLTDKTGNTLYTHTYNGPITGAMMATLGSFTPVKTYTDVTLTARLQHNGALVEAATVHYDCAAIEGLECTPPEVVTTTTDPSTPTTTLLFIIASIILLLLIGGIGIMLYQKRHGREASSPADDATEAARLTDLTNFHKHMTEQNKTPGEEKDAPEKNTGTKIGMFLVLVLAGGMLLPTPGSVVEAQKSTTVTKSHDDLLMYQPTTREWRNVMMAPGLTNAQISVGYSATIYKWVSGVGSVRVPHNGTVPVGTLVKFVPVRGSVSYTGTGHTYDTPLGDWVSRAAIPTASPGIRNGRMYGQPITFRLGTCNKGYLGKVTWTSADFSVYAPLSVHPAAMRVGSWSGSTATLSHVSGPWYRVTSPGALKTRFDYDTTYARFYYEYYAKLYFDYTSGVPMCVRSWDQYPMRPQGSSVTDYSIPIPATSIQYNIIASCPGGTTWNGSSCAAPNTPPSANAGPNANIFLPTNSHTVSGASASDPDGPAPSLAWSKVSGPAGGNITGGTTLSPTFSNLNTAGTYRFRLTVTDNQGATDTDDMEVAVSTAPITAPTLSFSGSPTTITEGDSATLTWTVGGTADSCWASWLNGGSGDFLASPVSGDDTVSPPVTTIYTLECWNQAVSSGLKTETITVNPLSNYDLTINQTGPAEAAGTVILNPGSNCATDCTRSYTDGTNVSLAGSIGNGSVTFSGAGCSGSTCSLSMTTDRSVDAEFTCNSGYSLVGSSCVAIPSPTLTFTPDPTTPLTAGDDANDDVTLSWTVTDVTSCTASGDWSGAKNAGGGSQTISDLTTDQTYILSCTGPGGTVEETVTVDVLSRPDLTSAGYSVIPSAGFDLATGEYDYLEFAYRIENNGETTAGNFTNSLTFDGSGAVDAPPPVGSLAAGATTPNVIRRLADNVPFGAHEIILSIDNTNAVTESDETNNELVINTTINGTLPPPDPNIELTINPDLVRSGETADVTWDVKATFFDSCTVLGQGINETFSPATDGVTDTAETAPISFKTEYLLTCTATDAAGNTHTFADSAFVETVGTYEEI